MVTTKVRATVQPTFVLVIAILLLPVRLQIALGSLMN
jgi:hypothetical protein